MVMITATSKLGKDAQLISNHSNACVDHHIGTSFQLWLVWNHH